MNHYEEKQAAKRERLELRAEKARAESQATFSKARQMAEAIPFGQPILVGHHSETRDRNYRGRIDTTFRKSFSAQEKAQHLERRAESVGTGGISSDDPDAVIKLRAELAEVEGKQSMMKAANAAIRKHNTLEAKRKALADIVPETMIERVLVPDFAGRVGFPPYMLSNNNQNGARIRARIAQLEKAAARESVEESGRGYTYREDSDENRVMFLFEGKPAEAVRAVLKRHAFRWSPSRGAWVRQLTGAGQMAGAIVRKALDALEG